MYERILETASWLKERMKQSRKQQLSWVQVSDNWPQR
jgi:hypothetical protein